MSWISIISYENATGKLKKLYDRVKGPKNNVDNIMLAHSLRPHTMVGHMALYKNVLHNSENTTPKWFLETIGVYVSILNNCDYCVKHHLLGLKRLLNDSAKLLTLKPNYVSKVDIDELLKEGFSEGEVLEINQVTAYFNYANRTVLGLGVHTEGDILGLSPNNSSDENNWNHQ